MKVCKVDGCNNRYSCKGYCNRHYYQMKTHGKILERTMFDPNEFLFENDICKIKIFNRKGEFVGYSIIDKEDYEKVKDYKWSLDKDGYCCSSKGKLHRLLMDAPGGMQVDHKNHILLDNRKENLRICTSSQNHGNESLSKNNSSGYKGVYWNKQFNQWRAFIYFNNKNIHLGYFDIKEDAAKAYNEAALEYFGEFAFLNELERDKNENSVYSGSTS